MPDEQSDHPKHKEYIYFVDHIKYKTEHATLTGAQIEAAIPNFNPLYSLFLEEPGDAPDRLIPSNESVNLAEHQPRRLYTVPPAAFGL